MIFCQFQPGVAYKSVAYKKACILVTLGLFEDKTPLIASKLIVFWGPKYQKQIEKGHWVRIPQLISALNKPFACCCNIILLEKFLM